MNVPVPLLSELLPPVKVPVLLPEELVDLPALLLPVEPVLLPVLLCAATGEPEASKAAVSTADAHTQRRFWLTRTLIVRSFLLRVAGYLFGTSAGPSRFVMAEEHTD